MQMSTWDDNKGSRASGRMTQVEQRPSQDLGKSDFAADIGYGHQGHQVSLSQIKTLQGSPIKGW
jgi:hypothetical protein